MRETSMAALDNSTNCPDSALTMTRGCDMIQGEAETRMVQGETDDML